MAYNFLYISYKYLPMNGNVRSGFRPLVSLHGPRNRMRIVGNKVSIDDFKTKSVAV